MKRKASFFAVLIGFSASGMAADITLTSGRKLTDARIVSIGKESVTIVHKAGSEAVAVDEVDLETLARAHMELAAKEEERKRRTAEIAAQQPKRQEEAKKKSEDRANLARAFENAEAGRGSLTQLSPTKHEARLIELKQRFPAQKKAKHGKYEYEVPTHDIYSHYRGMVQIATLDSVGRVVAQLESRLVQDIAESKRRADQAIDQSSEQAKYRATVRWLEGLRGYLSQLRAAR